MGKRKKVIRPPELPPEVRDDEIIISDDDIDFVGKNLQYAGFLARLDTKAINRHVVRVADQEDELESLYEKRGKKNVAFVNIEEGDRSQLEVIDALPIKTLEGELRYRTVKDLNSEDGTCANDADVDAANDGNKCEIVMTTKAERRKKAKQSKKEASNQLNEESSLVKGGLHSEVLAKVKKGLSAEELYTGKKLRLAEAGTKLLENPESNIKLLLELLQSCEDSNKEVVKLGLLSLFVIFKDIIPGYRIRLPTEKEFQMKVSKDVKRTRFFECTLLRSYKTYLLRLIDMEKSPNFHRVAVRCLCGLLEAVPHFNFRQSLLASVVKNISSSDDVVRNLCCVSVRSLFVNEGKHGGEATLEAVRLLAKHVKNHDCILHPDCVNVLLSLKFDEDLAKSEYLENGNVSKKSNRNANGGNTNKLERFDKKRITRELVEKTREEVNADFKSVSFVPDIKDRARVQTDTLSAVFETYFRILKHSVNSLSSTIPSTGGLGPHPLLAPCLSGLGKFSHLIDLDFMADLMGCLKVLAGHRDDYSVSFSVVNRLSVTERLQCCIVAFKVMRSNLDALNVDLNDFFIQLYNLLLEYRPGRDKGEVLAEALQIMLCEVKQHDTQRAAAFIKRLATSTLCFGSAEAIAALTALKHLLLKNSKCRSLMENDIGGGSLSGLVTKYQPDAVDPNLSGALSTVLWELSLLQKHYKSTISSMASSILNMTNTNGTTTTTQNQVYHWTASPLDSYKESSLDQESFVFCGKTKMSGSSYRKRKSDDVFFAFDKNFDHLSKLYVSEEELKGKLEDHFAVRHGISEKEKLQVELKNTISRLDLYKEYKNRIRRRMPKKGPEMVER